MKGIGFYNKGRLVYTDEDELIKENVKRILLTRRGERVGDLSFGSDLRRYIFMPEITLDELYSEIKNSVKRCDPRIEVSECYLMQSSSSGVFDIKVIVKKASDNKSLTVDVTV